MHEEWTLIHTYDEEMQYLFYMTIRHRNGAQNHETRLGPVLILMGKIRVDQDRGRDWVFPDSQSRVRGGDY